MSGPVKLTTAIHLEFWLIRGEVYSCPKDSPVRPDGVPSGLRWQCPKGVWDYHHDGQNWHSDL